MEWSGRRRYLPAVGFALVILVTSLLPVPEGASEQVPALLGLSLDKWVHVLSYGTLTVLLAWGKRARRWATIAALAALAIFYGAGVELLQGLVSSRGTSEADVAANCTGAVLAGLAWLVVRRPETASSRRDRPSQR